MKVSCVCDRVYGELTDRSKITGAALIAVTASVLLPETNILSVEEVEMVSTCATAVVLVKVSATPPMVRAVLVAAPWLALVVCRTFTD